MKYFVYWCDDHADNGGIGIESFVKLEDALIFIQQRYDASGKTASLSHYMLIHGSMKFIQAKETVTKIILQ